MLIHSASQLLTLAGGPQRGHALGSLGIIEKGAVLVRDEKIIAVGTTKELKDAYPDEPTLDAGNCVLMPGFVDPHTHLIWAGDRANEFEMKMGGMAYLDILAAGGGIISTVKATRTASMETLIAQTRPRLLRMFSHGTTTAEAIAAELAAEQAAKPAATLSTFAPECVTAGGALPMRRRRGGANLAGFRSMAGGLFGKK